MIKIFETAIKLAWEKYSAIIREANSDQGTQFMNTTLTKTGERTLSKFELFLKERNIHFIPSRRNHPQTNGKQERWFRTYEKNRGKFKSFNEFVKWYNNTIHLGLDRTKGITPNEAIQENLQPESILNLHLRLIT